MSAPSLSVNRLRQLLQPAAESSGGGAAPRPPPQPPRKKRKMAQTLKVAALEATPASAAAAKGKAVAAKEGGEAVEAAAAAAAAKPKKRHRRKLSQKRLQSVQLAAAAAVASTVSSGVNRKRKASSAAAGSAGSDQLLASKFRFLNEQLYTLSSAEAFAMFQADPTAFQVYHAGYSAQRGKWSEDPLDWVAKQCRAQLPADGAGVLVDFGCGDARLAERLQGRCRQIHSLDLVALNDRVTACDMSHSPLADRCAHVAVFCLSLMNVNLADFLAEASRVLRARGHLCLVEARSRVERTQRFVNLVERFGFQCERRREDKYLVYLLFSKTRQRKPSEPLPELRLKPCLYKQR